MTKATAQMGGLTNIKTIKGHEIALCSRQGNRMMDFWKEWVLDVTLSPPCFCPYESETGNVVVGMSLLTDRCPGELVGVFHHDGQEKAEEWTKDNPNWYEEFRKLQGETK